MGENTNPLPDDFSLDVDDDAGDDEVELHELVDESDGDDVEGHGATRF